MCDRNRKKKILIIFPSKILFHFSLPFISILSFLLLFWKSFSFFSFSKQLLQNLWWWNLFKKEIIINIDLFLLYHPTFLLKSTENFYLISPPSLLSAVDPFSSSYRWSRFILFYFLFYRKFYLNALLLHTLFHTCHTRKCYLFYALYFAHIVCGQVILCFSAFFIISHSKFAFIPGNRFHLILPFYKNFLLD